VEHFSRTLSAHELQLFLSTDSEHYPKTTIFAKVYVDEDVDVLVAHLLVSRGFDVKTVRELSMLGKSDPEQLEFATSLERCLLTHNCLDFEKLHIKLCP
jgi:hypothetical protein